MTELEIALNNLLAAAKAVAGGTLPRNEKPVKATLMRDELRWAVEAYEREAARLKP